MGKINHTSLVIYSIFILIISYFVFRAISSLNQGYSWQEMDWHQRGKTTLSDFFSASDIGKREIVKDNKKCVEYYAYKDGLTVKIVCPGT